MAFPNKTQLPVATSNRTNIDLSCQHITTSDFLQFNVAKAIEVVPNQSININMETFARFEPLAVPTFGRAVIKNRAYFVPYRTVFPLFNDFISDVPSVSGYSDNSTATIAQVTNVPLITDSVITQLFRGNTYSSVGTSSNFDFYYNDDGDNGYRKFTSAGRLAYKLFRSLGYQPSFRNDMSTYYSALPLLSLCRIYLDFYYPSQYANDADSAFLTALLRTDYSISDTFISVDQVRVMFRVLTKLTYESDYFTSAWDNANAPNSQLASSVTIPDVNQMQGADDIGDASPATKYDGNSSANAPIVGSSTISQFTLSALRALTDYMKRHQIAGSRTLDRYLSRFGVKLQAEKLNRCVFIGEKIQDVRFGDVTSTASTDNAELGAFAGQALSYGDGNFNFQSDEYGMIVIVSVVVPVTQYFQGINRHVRHLTKFDFYTPEFDNLGTQPISCEEVYVPQDGLTDLTDYQEKIFGFVPRYAEYKTAYSQITGDYVVNTLSTGKDSWTLFRDLKPYVDSVGISNLKHDINFIRTGDSSQFNRIFSYQGNDVDHINIIHNFDIKSSFPGKSLFNTYEFENEDKSQKVTMPVNGTLHN